MMHPGLLAALAFCYLLLLFAVARFGDTHREGSLLRSHATIYPLSLAIYCTTWTFFGSVGLAASSGLSFLTIYLGPILVMTIGYPVLKKVISLSKQQRITSVADFLGARYGKSVRVAAVATIICVVGTVPYIALQLKAVSTSLSLLISPQGVQEAAALPLLGDFSLFIVVVLAIFTILFGTRHADATEHQDGLMLAIALESAIKLAAFLIVGIFITWFMFDGLGDLYAKAASNERIRSVAATGADSTNLIVLTVLSTLAFMLLPRQFHVAVVENYSERELNRARWLFPLYLVLINLFVLPIAAAGVLTFGDTLNGDHFVLALPETAGKTVIAAIAFLGGLSAGTAMVIVACVALAIMISNHLVLPAYLRGDGYDIREDPTDMEQRILVIRRTAITLVLLLAYAYYKAADNSQALASIGLVSFAAAAQLAPAFFGGLFWRGANARGAIAGMVLGLLVWAQQDRPDILISDNGRLFGIKAAQGRVLNSEKGNGFAASSWLDNDGDLADQAAAFARPGMERSRGRAVMEIPGLGRFVYFASKKPGARADAACGEAAILLAPSLREAPGGRCLFVGAARLDDEGAMAIRVVGGRPSIEGAKSANRGRPWTRDQDADR